MWGGKNCPKSTFYTWECGSRAQRAPGLPSPDTIFIHLDQNHHQLWFDLVAHWLIVSLTESDTVMGGYLSPSSTVTHYPLPFAFGGLATDVSGTIITQSSEYSISISNSTCTTGLCQCLSRCACFSGLRRVCSLDVVLFSGTLAQCQCQVAFQSWYPLHIHASAHLSTSSFPWTRVPSVTVTVHLQDR